MRVVAFDLSLTRTGVADSSRPCEPFVLAPPGKLGRSWGRLGWIQGRAMELLEGCDLAVFEGYAFQSKTNAVAAGELGGIVKFTTFRLGVPFIDIAPGTLKKVATGKGNAPKEEVLVAAVHRLGYDGHDNNEADALWLLQAAAQHYDLPCKVDLPKSHTSTLHKVAWPEVAAERSVA